MKRTLEVALPLVVAGSLAALLARSSRAEVPDAGGPFPAFDATPIPTERSPPPKPSEWKDAKAVALSRNKTPCMAYRVREWIKVVCNHVTAAGIGQITGPVEGVSITVSPPINGSDSSLDPTAMEVVFPLRPGTGHVFQFMHRERNMMVGIATALDCVLTDHWVAGEPAPFVTLD